MADSLLDQLKGLVTPEIVARVGGALGESEDGISKGFGAAIPALLGGLVSKTSDEQAAGRILSLINDGDNDGSVLNDIGSLLGDNVSSSPVYGLGQTLLGGLFGGKTEEVADGIASEAGLQKSSVTKILGFLAPLLLAVLGKNLGSGASLAGLTGLISGQKDGILASLSGGLMDKLGGLLGLGALGGLASGALGGLGNLASGLTGAVTGAAGAVGGAASSVVGGVADLAEGALDKAKDAGAAVVEGVSNVAEGAADAVKNVAEGAADLAGDAVDAVKNAGGAALGAAGDAVKGVVGGAANLAGDAVEGVKDAGAAVAGAAGKAVGAVGDTAGKAVGAVADGAEKAFDAAGDAVGAVTGGLPKWLLPLLAILAVGTLAYFLSRGCAPAPEQTASETGGVRGVAPNPTPASELPGGPAGTEATPQPEATPAPAEGGLPEASAEVKLPDGSTLKAAPGGIEEQLIAFLQDASKPVDKETWFNFDRLLFDTGKSSLKPESKAQIDNIVAILKAFPNVNIKIGGYTDNTGSKEANQKLSEARASTVMNAIGVGGIAKSRLESEGYGDQHAVAPNDTEEGRAKNRRIAVRVTKK